MPGSRSSSSDAAAVERILASAAWARDLTPDELGRVARGLSERHYRRGDYICHRGDRFEPWTGVISGLVKISAISRDGKPMTFAGIGAGGWFGEGTLLKNEARKYDLVVLRDTHLAILNRATFIWLYENSVAFDRFLVEQLNERMGQFIATIEYDRILDPKARVARNLSWLFNPVLYPGIGRSIEITQEELALLAGVSRPLANRALKELEAEGLLSVASQRVDVADIEALARYE